MLDDKDEALLAALRRNARASVVDLARVIGLSRSATQERLARLERDGVIAGYTVQLGSHRPRNRIRAWLMIRHGANGNCAKSLPFLRAIPEVRAAFGLAGDIDMLAEVEVPTTDDLQRMRTRIESIPGVAMVSTHVVLSAYFERSAPDHTDRCATQLSNATD